MSRSKRSEPDPWFAYLPQPNELLPWDAMVLEVRRSGFRVAWVDARLEALAEEERALRANAGEDGLEVGERNARLRGVEMRLLEWLGESRRERMHLAQTAKRAIDAGLDQRLVSRVALEAETLNRVIMRTLAALNLDDAQQDVALTTLREVLEEVAMERTLAVSTGGGVGSGWWDERLRELGLG